MGAILLLEGDEDDVKKMKTKKALFVTEPLIVVRSADDQCDIAFLKDYGICPVHLKVTFENNVAFVRNLSTNVIKIYRKDPVGNYSLWKLPPVSVRVRSSDVMCIGNQECHSMFG